MGVRITTATKTSWSTFPQRFSKLSMIAVIMTSSSPDTPFNISVYVRVRNPNMINTSSSWQWAACVKFTASANGWMCETILQHSKGYSWRGRNNKILHTLQGCARKLGFPSDSTLHLPFYEMQHHQPQYMGYSLHQQNSTFPISSFDMSHE